MCQAQSFKPTLKKCGGEGSWRRRAGRGAVVGGKSKRRRPNFGVVLGVVNVYSKCRRQPNRRVMMEFELKSPRRPATGLRFRDRVVRIVRRRARRTVLAQEVPRGAPHRHLA
jgi:hypothetical protein